MLHDEEAFTPEAELPRPDDPAGASYHNARAHAPGEREVTDPLTSSIYSTLKGCPLCQEITRFLIRNENAMDTARGIASFWVGRDELAVKAALERLIICGAVTIHTLSSGTLYGLTRDQEIRAWLRTALGGETKRGHLPQGNNSLRR